MCDIRKISYILFGTKYELGGAIGKGSRTLLAVTDKAFKELILKEYENPARG